MLPHLMSGEARGRRWGWSQVDQSVVVRHVSKHIHVRKSQHLHRVNHKCTQTAWCKEFCKKYCSSTSYTTPHKPHSLPCFPSLSHSRLLRSLRLRRTAAGKHHWEGGQSGGTGRGPHTAALLWHTGRTREEKWGGEGWVTAIIK